MENRLKERLTGAAILVALIVLVVPEIFRGQGGRATTAGANGSDGPPLRSYTIDLSNNAKGSGPPQTTTDAVPAAKDEPPKESASAPAKNPADAAGARPEAKPEISKPSSSAAASSHASPPAKGARAPRAIATPSPVPGKPAAGGWSVQLGLFSKRENADRLVNEAKAKGFSTSISGPDAKGLFHVRAAGGTDRDSALILSQRLKSEGFQAAVVTP